MISIAKHAEINRIGDLNATELHELSRFICIKNGMHNIRYALDELVTDAKDNPNKRVYEYVREKTSK